MRVKNLLVCLAEFRACWQSRPHGGSCFCGFDAGMFACQLSLPTPRALGSWPVALSSGSLPPQPCTGVWPHQAASWLASRPFCGQGRGTLPRTWLPKSNTWLLNMCCSTYTQAILNVCTAQCPAEHPAEHPAQHPAQRLAQHPAQRPAQDPAQRPPG